MQNLIFFPVSWGIKIFKKKSQAPPLDKKMVVAYFESLIKGKINFLRVLKNSYTCNKNILQKRISLFSYPNVAGASIFSSTTHAMSYQKMQGI